MKLVLSVLLLSACLSTAYCQDSTRVSPIVVNKSSTTTSPEIIAQQQYQKRKDLGLQFSFLGAVALTTAATFSAAYYHENRKNADKPGYKVKSVDPYWFAGGFALLTVGITLDISASHKIRK